MKTKLVVATSILLGLSFIPSAAYSSTTTDDTNLNWKKVQIQPSKAEVRPYYDENQAVTVELSEYLPSPCYRPAPVESHIDMENRRVIINDYAFYRSEGICPMVVEPSKREVQIGTLTPGTWELWIGTNKGQEDKAGDFAVQ